jgi:hypothetical protein
MKRLSMLKMAESMPVIEKNELSAIKGGDFTLTMDGKTYYYKDDGNGNYVNCGLTTPDAGDYNFAVTSSGSVYNTTGGTCGRSPGKITEEEFEWILTGTLAGGAAGLKIGATTGPEGAAVGAAIGGVGAALILTVTSLIH